MNSFDIFLAVSHQQPAGGRINKIAPTSYAFLIRGGDGEKIGWGYGGARETKEMLAHGLYRAAEIVLIDDDENQIQVVVSKPGFQEYLHDFVPNWLLRIEKDPAFARNNLDVWKRLFTIWELGNLSSKTDENAQPILDRLQTLARRAARQALCDLEREPSRYSVAGVFVTDETASLPDE